MAAGGVIAQLLSEWGATPERLPFLMAFPQVRNPSEPVLRAADNLQLHINSLVEVFQLKARHKNHVATVTFSDAKMERPVRTAPDGSQVPYFPADARRLDLTYSAPLKLTITLTHTIYSPNGEKTEVVNKEENIHFGNIPLVVRSGNCNTAGLTQEELEAVGESRTDPGGYVILNGQMYAIRLTESLTYNDFTIHDKRQQSRMYLIQGQVISKPGDAYENSAQMQVFVAKAGGVFVEIAYGDFGGIEIPFRILFRALHFASDEDILRMILYDLADHSSETRKLKGLLAGALRPEPPNSDFYEVDRMTEPEAIQAYLGWLAARRYRRAPAEDARSWADHSDADRAIFLEKAVTFLTAYFLPHVGTTLDPDVLYSKAEHLAFYIRQTLLVAAGVRDPTDRDSYYGKRIHDIGVQFSKEIKTQMNLTTIKPMQNRLTEHVKAAQATQATKLTVRALASHLISPTKLESQLSETVKGAEKPRRGQSNATRMSTERIEIKNGSSIPDAVRVVRAPNRTSKQTVRADMLRRVHPTYAGRICPIKSADTGENVGKNKGLAVGAVIAKAGVSALLQRRVASDPAVISLRTLRGARHRVLQEKLAPVSVNGLLVGYAKDPYQLRRAYVQMRRRGEIDRRATVSVEVTTGHLRFHVDTGRVLVPYVVVEDNYEEWLQDPDECLYLQRPRVTRAEIAAVLRGELTVEDLECAGKLEYLAAEEEFNCVVAPTVEALAAAAHDPAQRYTHVYVHPAGTLALTSLNSPFPHHSQAVRVTYLSQQSKGAQSVPVTNPRDYFQQVRVQPYTHFPAVSSIGAHLTAPGGQNVPTAVLMAEGVNQEDSSYFSRQAIDRGLFNLTIYKPHAHKLKQNERFADPLAFAQSGGARRSVELRDEANYEYLGANGVIAVGSPVVAGTALIGVVETVQAPDSPYTHRDRSVVYHGQERGVVEVVVPPETTPDGLLCKVVVRFQRPLQEGDKICAASGNKAIVCRLVDEWELPCDETGMRVAAVFSPLSFPTRMTFNQIIELGATLVASERGGVVDATAFNNYATEGLFIEATRLTVAQCRRSANPELQARVLFGVGAARLDEIERDPLAFPELTGVGKKVLFHPGTGQTLNAIVLSMEFIMRFAKFGIDETYAVTSGATNALTKQPTEGRRHHGGLRLGEMEKACLLVHGTSSFFSEKWYNHSSGQSLYTCATCREFVDTVNEEERIYFCSHCQSNAVLRETLSDWNTNLLQHFLNAQGVGVRPITAPHELVGPAPAAVADGSAWD